MTEKQKLLWKYLYSTLTTTQIQEALRHAELTWLDWHEFNRAMREENVQNEG